MQDQDRPGFTPPPEGLTPEASEGAAPGPTETPSSGPRNRRVGAGVVVAAIGIGALGIAGAAYAAASDPAPSSSSTEQPDGGFDRDGDHGGYGLGGAPGALPEGAAPGQGVPGGRPGHGGPDGLRGLAGAVHGTFVVPQQDGSGYQTVALQRGKVTAVSATSISVTSDDGFAETYVVDSTTVVNRDGTISDIASGASVIVMAVKDGDTLTAHRIIDAAALGAALGGDHDGDGPGAGPLAPNSPPATT